MAIISSHNPWAFAFGILGNIISFIVFLAPMPTFIRVWKKKSTEGFHSLPYVAALFSCMLWLYYATQKDNVFLLITINAFGCFIETVYLSIFIAFAHKQVRMQTMKLLLLVNFGGFCLILLLCQFLAKGSTRAKIIGGICVGFSVCVFAAPLSIIRTVIKTRSVEYMPFNLSFFLTISAVAWLLYGISLKDIYIAFPNVFGFVLGALQMILYIVYKYCKTTPLLEENEAAANKLPEHSIDMVKLSIVTPESAISVAHPASTYSCEDRTVKIGDAKNGTESPAK